MTTMPRDEHGFIKVACPTCGEQLFGVHEWSAGDPIAEAMTTELRALREENERLRRLCEEHDKRRLEALELLEITQSRESRAVQAFREEMQRLDEKWKRVSDDLSDECDAHLRALEDGGAARRELGEARADVTRLSSALSESGRQHMAALADLEKAELDVGRLQVWHERALEERDTARRERDEVRDALREACDGWEGAQIELSELRSDIEDDELSAESIADLRKRGGIAGTEGSAT